MAGQSSPRHAGAAFAAISLTALIVVACVPTQVAIQARFPARYQAAAELHRLAVGPFNGRGGNSVSRALQATLTSATFDGQPIFTIIASNSGNGDPVTAARAAGAQAVLGGQTNIVVHDEAYQGYRSVCTAEDSHRRCTHYESVAIPCTHRIMQVTAIPSMVRTADGVVVYSAQHDAQSDVSWCQGQTPNATDDSMFSSALGSIITGIRRDIAPYNAVLNATIKESHDGLPAAAADQFDQAVAAAKASNLGEACRIWHDVDTASPNHVWTVYDLGVCSEAQGDYPTALASYQRAQQLGAQTDRDVVVAIKRVDGLMGARNQLASIDARHAATARAEAERVAEAQRQSAAAAAARRNTLVARYGAAAADAILAGQINTGMTPDQVRASRGNPERIDRVPPSDEMWIYGSTHVFFANGHVAHVTNR